MGDGNDILLATPLPHFCPLVPSSFYLTLFLSSVALLQTNRGLIPSRIFLEGAASVFNIESWSPHAGPVLTVIG